MPAVRYNDPSMGIMPHPKKKAWFMWELNRLLYLMNYCDPNYDGTRATNYYLSQSGSDSNNGTSTATPMKTWAGLCSKYPTVLTGSNIAVFFHAGDTWYENIIIPSNAATTNRTFSAYGDATLGKPKISSFTNITGWALESGTTYTYSVSITAAVGHVRHIYYPLSQQLVHVASAAAVEATPGTWYSSGTKIYVRLYSDAVPSNNLLQYSSSTVANIAVGDSQSGQSIDGILIRGIEVEGGGIKALGTEYSIYLSGTNSDTAMVVGCNAYYGGIHQIGTTGEIGISVFTGNRVGWNVIPEESGNPPTLFVAYAAHGNNESYVIGNVAEFGLLPGWGTDATVLFMTHTSGGSYYNTFCDIAYNVVKASASPMCSDLGSATLPPTSGLSNIRGFIHDNIVERGSATRCRPFVNYMASFNNQCSVMPIKQAMSGSNDSVEAYAWNNTYEIDLSNFKTAAACGWFAPTSAAANTWKMEYCNILVRNNAPQYGRSEGGVNNIGQYYGMDINSSNKLANTVMYNSIYAQSQNPGSVGFRLGKSNSGIKNNAYYNVKSRTDANDGYSNDPNPIMLDSPPTTGMGNGISHLRTTSYSADRSLELDGVPLEYDINHVARGSATPIGPWETANNMVASAVSSGGGGFGAGLAVGMALGS